LVGGMKRRSIEISICAFFGLFFNGCLLALWISQAIFR
jgi:hypothetical protein